MFLAFYHRTPHIGNIFYVLCGYAETGLTRIVRDNARIAQEQICTSILVIFRYRSTHAEKGWEIIFHEFHYVGNCTPTFRNFTLLLDILIFLFFSHSFCRNYFLILFTHSSSFCFTKHTDISSLSIHFYYFVISLFPTLLNLVFQLCIYLPLC